MSFAETRAGPAVFAGHSKPPRFLKNQCRDIDGSNAASYMTSMTDDRDHFPCTELDVAGTFFDAEFMLELKRKSEVGLWMWTEEWQPYRMEMG
jgi:hypothetical protein